MPAYDNMNAPDSFADYSASLRKLSGARVDPMLYQGEDGSTAAPYAGTFGHFDAHSALAPALVARSDEYGGDLPIEQQPRIVVPDPWLSRSR